MFSYSNPLSVSVKADGRWHKASGEISIENNAVYLTASHASWVRLDWSASFSPDARVLRDAWERTYGDIEWQPIGIPMFSPWYVSVRDGGMTRCFGVKTGPAALCSWSLNCNSISLLMDVRCGCKDTQLDGRRVLLAELVSSESVGDPYDAIHNFCCLMCDHPKLPAQPIYGGDDWYATYSDNSFDRILRHARILAECSQGLSNRPYQMIDAGWQLCHNWFPGEEYIGGPFRYCNSKFGSMKDMADAIRELDVRPGIWIRPLETVEYLPEHAFLRRNKNIKYLDPSHPAAQEILDNDIRTLHSWGYDMIKWDFLVVDTFGSYGFAMSESVTEGDWSFYETHKTSAEIVREYYQRTVDAAEGSLINTCNTFSHLSAGIFSSFRIGDDTSGLDYARTVKMGVNTLAFRGVQHKAMYSVDADCVGITHNIPWEKNLEWLRLLQYSGTPLMVSVEDASYTPAVRDAITEGFALASVPHETARPLDWDEGLTPRHWLTFDGEKEFNW